MKLRKYPTGPKIGKTSEGRLPLSRLLLGFKRHTSWPKTMIFVGLVPRFVLIYYGYVTPNGSKVTPKTISTLLKLGFSSFPDFVPNLGRVNMLPKTIMVMFIEVWHEV